MSTTTPPPIVPPRKRRWITPGQVYQKAPTGKETAVDADITIPESDGIVMGGKKSRYGVPVNARLAIYYIRKLWMEIERKRLLMIHQDTNDFFENFIKVMDSDVEKFDKDEFVDKLKVLDGRWREANTWLIELLRNSFGITMERSILLKTLSQPECEGIRYYLAMKKTSEDHMYQPGDILDGQGFPVKLTLVTVGVDKEGTDLHYLFDPRRHTIDSIPEIENASLCTEYPSTPGINEKYSINMPELKPYVLFRYAMVKDEE